MASYTITQKAFALLAAEEQQKRIQEQQRAALLAAETSAKAEAERNERIRLETERELTRAAVERSLIEKAAAEAQAAEAVALQAELTRLRNRNETEILRDEMSQMRAEIAALKARPIPLLTPPPQDLHLRIDGELDMRFKTSKEELATARAEIAELKALVRGLCVLAGQAENRIANPYGHENLPFLHSLTQPCRHLYYADQETARKMEKKN